jgi:hypothetical protein
MKMLFLLFAVIITLSLIFLHPALAVLIIVIVIGAGIVVFLKNK